MAYPLKIEVAESDNGQGLNCEIGYSDLGGKKGKATWLQLGHRYGYLTDAEALRLANRILANLGTGIQVALETEEIVTVKEVTKWVAKQ